MKHEYYKNKMVKMGYWPLMASDSENWHSIHTSEYFFKTFGFYKGTLVLHEIDTEKQHCYFPQYYFDKLFKYITDVNKKDYKSLSRKLNKFYTLKKKAKIEIPKISTKDYTQLNNRELVNLYVKNRDWAHQVTVYDQFGWIGEDYWEPHMANVLVNKLGIEKDSAEYHRVLFILTKPEEISTTLEEKRDSILELIKVKQGKKTLDQASKYLAKKYGWMPVFTYGTPWDQTYYKQQLQVSTKKKLSLLEKEYQKLKDYKKAQKKDIESVLKKYDINPRDLQLFIDFSLALDARNEAEYLVSLAGFYLLPIYKEIARRLHISINQLRTMFQNEAILALQGKLDVAKLLREKGRVVGWGFNHGMDKQITFDAKEAEKLLNHLNKKSKSIHGHDEAKGKCASPGKARGKARIIMSPEQNHRVKEGDILICHATTVDYLPAMKKAAAFVTEVGSLTCHAAVVAREFGVPCIVSLKNATKNFKDGQVIELDANQGSIK